jgi:hypothetical protein
MAAVVLALLVLGTLIAAGVSLLARGPGNAGGPNAGTDEHPVAFELEITRIGLRSVAQKLSRTQAERAVEDIRLQVQDLYLAGFLDPERWQDGEFPDAFGNFDEGAAARARNDLNALTLGDTADEMEWVEPKIGRASIVFLLDQGNRPVTAVAGVVFRATGHLKDGGTVAIESGADLFLRPIDGVWRIFSYTASTTVEPPEDASPSASPGAAGGGG